MDKNAESRVKEIKKIIKFHRLMKTISWRLIAWCLTITLTWLFIGDITVALSIGTADVAIKLIGFYLHDTAWAKYTDRKIKEIKAKFPKV